MRLYFCLVLNLFDIRSQKLLSFIMENMPSKSLPPTLWQGQILHLASLFLLLMVITFVWSQIGKPSPTEFWIAVAIPILHQVWVWVNWRLELRSSAISRSFGFQAFLWVFFSLFAARFLTLMWLAIQDHGSLGLSSSALMLVTLILLIPGLYSMISVKLYFGMSRAAGGDHFNERYRAMPLVRKGIFRYTENGMYVYAFLLFWAIATSFNSVAALLVAAFSHAYIWVHYFATEKLDMDYLYGPRIP